MTAFMLDNLATLPALAQSLRMLLKRLARGLDALVSARAERSVPDWRMQEVQDDIARFQRLIAREKTGSR